MSILHISSILDENNGGGVMNVVPNFVKYQSNYVNTALLDINSTYNKYTDINIFKYCKYKNINALPEPFNHPNLVVFHEVYKKEFIKLYKECIKLNIPYVVVPHCCMTKYAQSRKKLKKIIGNIFLFNNFLKNAKAIHFLSQLEKDNSNLNNNSFLIGNGYKKEFDINYNTINNSNYFIYVGRYDVYHKGLDFLIDACDYSKNWFRDNNLYLKLYGVTKEQELLLKKIVSSKKIDDFVIVNGPIFGKEKINIITNSISFIQTSRFEGLPQGISEALMYGVPCIVTKGTAFYEYVKDNECGIAVEYNNESITSGFKKMYKNKEFRVACSKNATKHSNKDFDWDEIGRKCINEYKKIINFY